MTRQQPLGIAQVSARTGLSKDTLRWYEKEGLIPALPRDSAGRRAFDEASVRIVDLVVRLKRTGMPIGAIREFIQLVGLGAQSHGRRSHLLQAHRDRILQQQRQLAADLVAVEEKIRHYEDLISAGLDCAGEPVTNHRVLALQRLRTLDQKEDFCDHAPAS